jgi:hypothetical protein
MALQAELRLVVAVQAVVLPGHRWYLLYQANYR